MWMHPESQIAADASLASAVQYLPSPADGSLLYESAAFIHAVEFLSGVLRSLRDVRRFSIVVPGRSRQLFPPGASTCGLSPTPGVADHRAGYSPHCHCEAVL